MSQYRPKISENDGGFYTLIIRIDEDGQENVIHGYKGRHLASRKAAEKSANSYIAKHKLND